MNTDRDRLPAALALALADRGHAFLTDAQRAVLDPSAEGRDLVLSARTGSGKTLAFGLALAPVLLRAAAPGRAPRALVVAPTRELARQVAGELGWLYGRTAARILLCAGGADPRAERRALRVGCDLAIGSPGRLRDHLTRGALDLSRIEAVVIDEADDMLDLGFRAELEALLRATPVERRTLMVSATIGPKVLALALAYQRDPLRIEVAGAPADIRFQAVAVAPAEREGAVANLLRLHEAPGAIVFCARREAVAALAARLRARGFQVVALSGALPQRERDAALAAMRSGQARVCVATDLAARGLDLPGLDLVVHADPPANPAVLTHRSGRAGRAGQAGLAVLVVPHRLRRRVQAMADGAGVSLEWSPAPGPEAILARDEARLLAALTHAPDPKAEERAAAARLLAVHDAERLAVALLRLAPAASGGGVAAGGPGPRPGPGQSPHRLLR